MQKAITLHPVAVICSSQAAQVDANEVEISKTRQVGIGKICYLLQEDIHYGMLLELVPFGTPAQVAFSRDAFIKSGGWDSSLDANFDDIDSWIKIAQFGDAIFINDCLSYRTLWEGAYNQKFALIKRLNTNILIKERIYANVNHKYHNNIPQLPDIQAYLKLHWSLVALKQGKIIEAVKISLPALLNSKAWMLLWQKYQAQKSSASKSKEQLQQFFHPLSEAMN